MFQGAGTFPDSGLGHGPSIVLRLTKFLPKGSFLYFDRFFTTIPLMVKLEENGFKATGTIMGNRLGKRVNFPSDKQMERGSMAQFVKDDEVAVVKWCDTKCVTIASTACGKDPVGEVERWIKAKKRRLPVPIPAVIQLYNSKMGGVDTADQMMEYYRISMKTKKWPVKVFFHYLDMAIYNSWMEYRNDARIVGVPKKNIKTFLTFKLEIGEVLAKYKEAPPEIGEPFELPHDFHGTKFRPHNAPDDIRYDRYDHWPQFVDGTAKRCRNTFCESRTRAICQKCKVSLCVAKDKDCFKEYHIKR